MLKDIFDCLPPTALKRIAKKHSFCHDTRQRLLLLSHVPRIGPLLEEVTAHVRLADTVNSPLDELVISILLSETNSLSSTDFTIMRKGFCDQCACLKMARSGDLGLSC